MHIYFSEVMFVPINIVLQGIKQTFGMLRSHDDTGFHVSLRQSRHHAHEVYNHLGRGVRNHGQVCVCSLSYFRTNLYLQHTFLLRFFFTYWKNRLQESIGTERAAEQRMELGDVLKRASLGYFA